MAANWRKVVVSGSAAQLSSLSVDDRVNITGSLNASDGIIFAGLTNASKANIVSYDTASGQLFYQGTGSFSANSASYAVSASQAVSASYALSASQAESASYAVSASHAISADTASSVGILNQPVIITGSLAINTTTGNSFAINADTFNFTGSLSTTGSVSFVLTEISKSYVVGYDTASGQLTYQTAVDNADTASFAISASQAANANSASYALTASYALNVPTASVSASYALSASNAVSSSYALSSSNAESASFATTTVSSSYALSSSYASTASFAISASSALTASFAGSASFASTGDGIFSGSFSGSFSGDGSQLTGVSASVLLFALSQSTGVTAFNYNGSATAAVQVSGSTGLTAGSVTKWTGDAFANSSITDLSNVTINNGGGVLIQAGGLYVTGAATFHDNVVMQANLIVQGTASFQNSQNLSIADQFILLNSGSATFQDSGIVIAGGNSANSGSAFFLETAGTTTGSPQNGRFAVAGSVNASSGSVTAESYMNTTVIDAADPGAAVPAFGGTGLGQGNMWVNTTTSDIWIYA